MRAFVLAVLPLLAAVAGCQFGNTAQLEATVAAQGTALAALTATAEARSSDARAAIQVRLCEDALQRRRALLEGWPGGGRRASMTAEEILAARKESARQQREYHEAFENAAFESLRLTQSPMTAADRQKAEDLNKMAKAFGEGRDRALNDMGNWGVLYWINEELERYCLKEKQP